MPTVNTVGIEHALWCALADISKRRLQIDCVQFGIADFQTQPPADRPATDHPRPIGVPGYAPQPAHLKRAQAFNVLGWDMGEQMAVSAFIVAILMYPKPCCSDAMPRQRLLPPRGAQRPLDWLFVPLSVHGFPGRHGCAHRLGQCC